MNRKMGSSWRDRCDHKNYNKLLNVYNVRRQYRQVSRGSIGDLHELLKREPDLNTVNKLLRANRTRLGVFLRKLGYGGNEFFVYEFFPVLKFFQCNAIFTKSLFVFVGALKRRLSPTPMLLI